MAAQVAPPMMEWEIIIVMVDTLLVFYYEKMVGYTPSSFAGTVFTGKRIEVGRKEANLIILLGRMRKLGQMKRVRMREKPML